MYFDIEVSAISKQSYIEDYFEIEAEIHIRISKFCTSISKIFDIEDLRYRIFHWFFWARLMLRRVAESECRLQPSTKVAKHRLQWRYFIATQFPAQDFKQYPLRSAWWRRRWSRGEGGVADGAAAASGARTDSIQQRPLLNRRTFVLGFIQDRLFRFTRKMECTQYHNEGFTATSQFLAPACPLTKRRNQMAL